MKYIVKNQAPLDFEKWKTDFQATNQREAKYSDLIGSEKRIVKESLISEQYRICCYCCNRIEDYNSHIEHFKPKGNPLYSSLQLEYTNLLASCEGIKDSRDNCGHKKDSWYSEYYTVSPLDSNCEDLFEYTIDGQIRAAGGDTRAKETIDNLDLNSNLLCRARKSAIYLSGIFDNEFVADKEKYINYFTYPQNNELEPFCNAILFCMKKY